MYLELVRAHQAELAAAARTIEFRRQYESLSRIDRLERALKSARSHLQLTLSHVAPAA